jgi:hypothetical protein
MRRALVAQPICVVCGDHARSAHHVYPRGQGGDDTPENLVSVCGDGVQGCHGLLHAEQTFARWRVGRYLQSSRPDTIAYVQSKLGNEMGLAWLKRRYFIQ